MESTELLQGIPPIGYRRMEVRHLDEDRRVVYAVHQGNRFGDGIFSGRPPVDVMRVMIPAHTTMVRRDHGLHTALVLELDGRRVEAAAVCQASGAGSGEQLSQQTSEFRRRERVQYGVNGGVDRHHEHHHPN